MAYGLSQAFGRPAPLSAGPSGWNPLLLGAGGYITGMDVHSDGTLICRTDTYGCYLGNVTAGTVWQQMLSIASMPQYSVGFDASGQFVAGIGVYEIRVAPSNSSIFYMTYSDNAAQSRLSLFKTVNKGATWTRLPNFPAVTWAVGTENNAYRTTQQKMAIHPTDPNTVLIGTPANGLYYTTDGGTSFTNIAAVPASGADSNSVHPGITGICFDPATPTTCYAASFGNGVYRSTTGVTGTWSLITSSPQFVIAAVVNSGSYWCTGSSTTSGVVYGYLAANLFKFNGSAFSTNGLTASDGNGIFNLCFVSSSTIIVINAAGQIYASVNTGSTWAGPSNQMPIFTPADVPWLALTAITFWSGGGLVADPVTSGRIIQGMGIGVITVNMTWSSYTTSTTTPWVSQSAGIEQLVARKIVSPPGGRPLVAVEDRGVFYISDPTSYPSDYSTRPLSGTTCASWTVDYARSLPSTVAQASNSQSNDKSGLSGSSGQATTWSAFSTNPNPSNHINGGLAISTPANIVYFNYVYDTAPQYTINAGSTWTASSGLPSTGWSNFSIFGNAQIVCADDAGNGTFYVYNNGTNIVYRSTNNGASWSSFLTGAIT